MADPVQRHADPQHWTQHGPHRYVIQFMLKTHDLRCSTVYVCLQYHGFSLHATGGSGNFIYTLATGPQETEVARLVSPVVSSPDADLCVSFWYHMFGSHIGTLHIKQRKQTVDGPADVLLWTVSGHQGNRWREGRVLVPRTNKPYQVNFFKKKHLLVGLSLPVLFVSL